MTPYKYGIIDATVILVRNYKAFSHSDYFNEGALVKSFIQSYFKLLDTYEVGRSILVWDQKPYHKSKILKAELGKDHFKSGRDHVSEDKVAKEVDPIKKSKLQKELDNVKIMGKAKLYLLQNLHKIGVSSINRIGWEADDLAYIYADLLKNEDGKVALFSNDSDYDYYLTPNSDYINLRFNKKVTYEDAVKKRAIEGLSLMESKMWRESMRGSHNSLKALLKDGETRPVRILKNLYESGDTSFLTSPEIFKAQLKTFDIESYPEYSEVVELFKKKLATAKIGTVDDFKSILAPLKINIDTKHYKNYLNNINSELWTNKNQ